MLIRNLMIGTSAVVLTAVLGCDRGEVTAYDIPKETPPAQIAEHNHSSGDPHAATMTSRPSLKWGDLPEGWTHTSQSSGMRLASFAIAGEGDQSAELAIIPMGGFAGSGEQLVNMWRSQLGLSVLSESDAGGQGDALTIGGGDGQIYEMAGSANDVATRIIVASVNNDGVNFFFKLIGHDATVAGQKDAFLGFLKTLEFVEAETVASAPPMASSPVASAEETRWVAPENWEVLPATQFLLAKYQVAGQGDEGAQVTVSMLGGSGGGLLPNVNRWRGQLNLGPVDEAGLKESLQDIKAGSVDATLVEFEGTDLRSGTAARMLVVVVSLPAETWFFKMTGPIPVMDAKAAEFRSFVNATRF